MNMVVIQDEDLRLMIKNVVTEALGNVPPAQSPQDPEPATELMTRKEVRKLFNVSLPTLIAWSRENVLPCLHFKRSVRYKRSDVERLLKSKNKTGGVQ